MARQKTRPYPPKMPRHGWLGLLFASRLLKYGCADSRGEHALGPAEHGLAREGGQRGQRVGQEALRVHAAAHHRHHTRHLLCIWQLSSRDCKSLVFIRPSPFATAHATSCMTTDLRFNRLQ